MIGGCLIHFICSCSNKIEAITKNYFRIIEIVKKTRASRKDVFFVGNDLMEENHSNNNKYVEHIKDSLHFTMRIRITTNIAQQSEIVLRFIFY